MGKAKRISHRILKFFTATRLRKVLSSILAVLILATSIRFLFIKPSEVLASDVFIKFDEGYGTTGGANDTNGTVAAGNIVNAVWRTEDLCKVGKCLYFDGTGDYVSFSDSDSLDMAASDEVTINLWFRTGDITSGSRTLISKYETTGADGGYQLYMNSDGKIVFGIDSDNSGFPLYSVTSSSVYDDNRWHFLSAVKNGTTSLILYIDANHQGTTSITSTNASNDDTFYIGINNALANGFMGFIDEVKVLRSARTADLVKTDYTGQTPERGVAATFGPDQSYLSDGLVGYWKLDETSGSASDSAGLNNHLTNNGTTTYVAGKFGNGSEHVPASLQYFSAGGGSQQDTYYFDATDSGPTDPNGVWTNDPNAFDGSISTYAVSSADGSSASNFLQGDGTNAPTSGGTINSVQARIYGLASYPLESGTLSGYIYTESLGQQLGAATRTGTIVGWGSYTTLSTPTGGWTWQKINDLVVKIFTSCESGCINRQAYKVEVLVNSQDNQTIDGVKSVSFWTNPDALTNYYVSLTSGAYITSNSSGVLTATGFDNPKIYINGVQGNTLSANVWSLVTVTSETAINADQFYVGRVGSNYFDGTMDEVRLYNRALSPAEVQKLYNWAPGPILYFPFDENTGTSTVYDRSGNGYTGTMNGTMTEDDWVPGKFGSALDFDGTNDKITTTDTTDSVLDFTGDFTISAWVNRTGDTGVSQMVLAKMNSTTSGGYALALGNSGEVYCQTSSGGGLVSSYTATGAITSTSGWNHLSVVRTGSSCRVYVNSVDRTSSAGTHTTMTANNIDLSIADWGGSAQPFSGIVDDVKIYNYPRTSAQVTQDMNAGHPAPGSPVGSALGHWKFDEGYGDTAYNSGSGGSTYDGSLGGATSCPGNTVCPAWTNDGKFGKALDYNGTDRDYVEITGLMGSPADITVSAWVNLDSRDTNGAEIVNIGDYVILRQGTSFLFGGFHYGSSNWHAVSTSESIIGTGWRHVVLVIDDTNNSQDIYIDGILKGSASYTNSIVYSGQGSNTFIGRHANGSTLFDYDGRIDEVKIYNIALTADQVKVEFNQGSAAVWGATSTDSSGAASNASVNEYCPPGQATACVGPVAEWKFDENTGTYAYDTSENNNTGTLTNGPTWMPGKYGSGLEFNGSNSYVSIANHSSLNFNSFSGLTVSGWAKANQLPPFNSESDKTLYGYWSDTSSNRTFMMELTDQGTYASWQCGNNAYTGFTISTTPVEIGKWYHITCTWTSSSGLSIYINGVLENTDPTAGTTLNSNSNIHSIGARYQASSSQHFDGSIDNVKVYNYARTPAQIAWDYNRGDPVGHWRLDEGYASGTGNTMYDSSGNGNNGTSNWGANASGMDCSVAGKRNKACDFDGDDYISVVPGTIDVFDFGTGNFTWSAWVKTTQDCSSEKVYLSRYQSGTSIWLGCLNYAGTGKAQFSVRDSNSNSLETTGGSITINDGQWHHITGILEGYPVATLKVYVDGVLDKTASRTYTGNFDSSANFQIGRHITSYYAQAQIDEVKIFNYALTDQQIRNEFNAGTLNFGY